MSRGRRRTVKALVVLGSVLAFLSVFAIWTERQALNTDDWVDTSDRLIQNSTIRTAVGDYLVDQLYENVDVERELEGILPDDLKRLAGPASGGLRQVAGDGADELLKTSTAQSLWRDANRAAHEQLIAVLEDKKEAVSTEGGEVTLNLGSLVTNLAEQVGIGENLAQKLPPDAGQITILRSDQLKTAQNIAVGDQGPGARPLAPHPGVLRRGDLPLARPALGDGALLRGRADLRRLRRDRRPPGRRRDRGRPARRRRERRRRRPTRPGRSPPR